MNPDYKEGSVFSSTKPREIPWFSVPVMLGIVGLIVIFKWSN